MTGAAGAAVGVAFGAGLGRTTTSKPFKVNNFFKTLSIFPLNKTTFKNLNVTTNHNGLHNLQVVLGLHIVRGDNVAVIGEIDEELQKVNDDYAYVRKHSMPAPSLKVIPTKVFYDYLESINKLGAQNKIPRVMNKKQADQWNLFLKTNGFL